MNEIMLSIYVPTYNHENYIEQALDSILMQKTKYTYEVYVGEDCSTDNTRNVLKEYEKKNKGRLDAFTFLYRKENMRNSNQSNGKDLISRCKGKYIIALEGDDYWTDENKIEKQIDFLEKHSECIGVAHKCIVVDDLSKQKNEEYPECWDDWYSIKHFCSEIMPGQLTTVMYRNIDYDSEILNQKFFIGDRVTFFRLLSNGKVYCMKDCMSAYRHVVNKGSSFSATYKGLVCKDCNPIYKAFLQYSREKMNDNEKYCEFLLLRNTISGIKMKQFSKVDVYENIKLIKHFSRTFFLYLKYLIKKNIFKSNIWV